MKYLFSLAFLLIAGCSTSTTPSVPPYAPGGEYYVAPGTFTGIWVTTYVTSSNVAINDTNPCSAVLTEADSILVGTLTNDSTNDALGFRGTHDNGPFIDEMGTWMHSYITTAINTVGDTGGYFLNFSHDGNTLTYNGWTNRASSFSINCVRK